MKSKRASSRTIALAAIMVIYVLSAKADALAAEQSFFTGKPYLPATGSYAFKYRSYQPELARWTSEDPSGFPDGANANIYAPTPTSEFDWMGLWKVRTAKDTTSRSTSGTVSLGRDIGCTSVLFAGGSLENIQSVSGQASGVLVGLLSTYQASAQMEFSINVNDSGVINITPGEGGWESVNDDLQIGSTYAITQISEHVTRLTFVTASIYNGSGLTGAGVLGAMLSWTSGTGKQSAQTFMDFEAYE